MSFFVITSISAFDRFTSIICSLNCLEVIWWFPVKEINDRGNHFSWDSVTASDVNAVSCASVFSEQWLLEVKYCITTLFLKEFLTRMKEKTGKKSAWTRSLPVFLSCYSEEVLRSFRICNLICILLHNLKHICGYN